MNKQSKQNSNGPKVKVQRPKELEKNLDRLTARQQMFVTEYLRTWNASEAAKRAGYKHPHVVGWQNFEKLCIKRAIDEGLRSMQLSREQVLTRLSQIANNDPTKFMRGNGGIDWDKVRKLGPLVKGWKAGNPRTGAPPEVELHDSMAALVNIGRYYKLFDAEQPRTEGAAGQRPITIQILNVTPDGTKPANSVTVEIEGKQQLIEQNNG